MNYPSHGEDLSCMLPKYAPQNAVSPTQLLAPTPPSHIPHPHLTLTPAQLLQQQQAPFQARPPQPRFAPPRDRDERAFHDHHDPDRPASSASARHDPSMPPPSSRPGTASGPRINPMHLNLAHMPMPIPLNRPPTRTGSALAHSPKHSPRIPLGPMAPIPAHMPPINGNMPIGIPNQAMPPMPPIPGMAPMGPINTPAHMAPAPVMMAGPAGPMMGPPVHPQAMQRLDRDPMMQHPPREAVGMVPPLPDQPHGIPHSHPSSSPAPFMGLDNPPVPQIGPNIPTMPRQGSQPPPQQSPARQVPPPHRSPMPPMRKMSEIPRPTATPPVNVPPIPGTTPGQKLPPHIASLNPAVTRISYIPYVVPKKESDASDDDKKPSDEATADADKDPATDSSPPVKIEDPVRVLTPSEITTLKGVMVRDSAYDTVYRAKQARMLQELRTAGPSGRLAWWDREYPPHGAVNRRPERFDVRYPRPPRADNSMGARKKGARREGIRMSVHLLSLYSRLVEHA